MSAARRGPAAVVFACLMAAAGGAALAYIQTNPVDQGNPDVGLYQGGTFTVRLEQDASFRITDGTDVTALVDAINRWTAVGTSNVVVAQGTSFDLANPVDASDGLGTSGNRLFFAETDDQNRIGSAIAVAFYSFATDGRIQDCDIVMNERLYTFSTATPANPNQILGSGTYDIGEIATHEMGHCLGLAHSPVAGRFSASTGLQVSGFSSGDFAFQATMYPYGTRTIQGRSLSDDDIAGVSFIYPDATLQTTRGRITGRVLDGGTFASIKGAHVVAVTTAAPDVPVVGAVSDLQAGGPGGEFSLVGLSPGSYYVRLEPLVGTSNPFTEGNTNFTGFVASFPWEYWDGVTESGFDVASSRTAITLVAGQTVADVVLYTNVGAPDPNEPNNTRPAATAVPCSSSRPGSIVPINDVDYYAVDVTDATTLTVDVSASRAGSPLDAMAAVMDAGGAILASADNTIQLDPVISLDLFTPGTYYVAVASYGDASFAGSGGLTTGSYTLDLGCVVPSVPAGSCRGDVLYATEGPNSELVAVADRDHDYRFDSLSTVWPALSGAQSQMIARRDGGVVVATLDGMLHAAWDDDGDFFADRREDLPTGLGDGGALAAFRRGGAEISFVGDAYSGGSVKRMVETGGDLVPESTTVFTADPAGVFSLAIDEAGTVYVLDPFHNEGEGAVLAYADDDGDGIADRSSVFSAPALSYTAILARAPRELFAADYFQGQIDRIRDLDGDGDADSVTPYATGLHFDLNYGLALDRDGTLYAVDGANRIVALPDYDQDGDADATLEFSPAMSGLAGIAFGATPPDEVSLPRSGVPLTMTRTATGLRLRWEDQGGATPAYNIYAGTPGSGAAPQPLACHVAGVPDGQGGRTYDIEPMPAGDVSCIVTASDACGESSAGRRGDGSRRPLPPAACGATN